jgi:hypothetical protein
MRMTSKMAMFRLLCGVAFLFLWPTSGHAEVQTPGQKDLADSTRKLEAARERVSATAQFLSAAQSLRMGRLGLVHACQTARDALERIDKEAQKAESAAKAEAIALDQLARQATLAVEPSRKEMERARIRFLSRPLLAYDLSQHGRLTYNALTGALDLTVDQTPGITINSGDLDALVARRFARTAVDPLEMAATMTASTRRRLTSNYAEVQARLAAEHGAGQFYLVSRRFLEWATPERLSGELALARTTRGAGPAAELTETQRQLQLEFEDVAVWLRLKGASDLGPDPAAVVAELIRTGAYPRLGLAVKTTEVEYYFQNENAGRTDVPTRYLKNLQSPRPWRDAQVKRLIEKRPAIAIIWKGPTGDRPPLAALLEGHFQQTAPALKDLAKLLPRQTDARLHRLIDAAAQHGLHDIDAFAGSRPAARGAVGLRKEDLAITDGSNRIILDLRRSDLGEIVGEFLHQLAMGNRKSVTVDVLELDQSTGRLEVEFTLNHRHVWNTVREAQLALRSKLGPNGTDVEDLADEMPDASFDEVRKLYHTMDLRCHETNTRAYEAEQRAHDAADRVATKAQELATLAAELARAETDLRIATERESSARQEAQAACAQMLALDAQVRFARNRANGLDRLLPTKPAQYGGRETAKKW